MVVTVFSPAKINLFLAVTGRRTDGFHDLVSLAAPLDFGDELSASVQERETGPRFRLECDRPDVPPDDSNLILKAAVAFAEATGWPGRTDRGDRLTVDFQLVKRIPMGAGLGGGSSNAVAALRALNRLAGGMLSVRELEPIAAKLGSDCPLFLHDAPVIIRGRGERIEKVSPAAAGRLRGQRVLLFKPSFGISTPWAYGRMAAGAPDFYLPPVEAEKRLAGWLDSDLSPSRLLFNSIEEPSFGKFVALPVLLKKLRARFGVGLLMSGSGSACFALGGEPIDDSPSLPEGDTVAGMRQMIRDCWGDAAFVQGAALL